MVFVSKIARQNNWVVYFLFSVEIFSRSVRAQTMKTKYVLQVFKKVNLLKNAHEKLGLIKKHNMGGLSKKDF